jgi:hypothetical protein
MEKNPLAKDRSKRRKIRAALCTAHRRLFLCDNVLMEQGLLKVELSCLSYSLRRLVTDAGEEYRNLYQREGNGIGHQSFSCI